MNSDWDFTDTQYLYNHADIITNYQQLMGSIQGADLIHNEINQHVIDDWLLLSHLKAFYEYLKWIQSKYWMLISKTVCR